MKLIPQVTDHWKLEEYWVTSLRVWSVLMCSSISIYYYTSTGENKWTIFMFSDIEDCRVIFVSC